MQVYYASRIAGALALLALLVASWESIRAARADAAFRRGTPEGVERALEIAPGNTEYLALRALEIEYDGGDATPLLERAAALNPLSSAPRLALGLAAEQRGDFVAAEKWLLEAAQVDRQFEPRWTLANFYFRREDANRFWTWMRSALEFSYGDRRPAFDLCWRETDDAAEILARAIPDRQEVVTAYLKFLLDTHRIAASAPVARKLAALDEAEERPLLLAAVDALLEDQEPTPAIQLWQALGYAPPEGVFNANFELPRIGHGFDWRFAEQPGVVHTDIDQPRLMHRITFDGRQPEACELARETMLLNAGAGYRLTWEARTSSLASPSGVEWRIAGKRISIDGPGQLEFTAPSDLTPLILIYQRPSGQARAEGSIELWAMSIKSVSIKKNPARPGR